LYQDGFSRAQLDDKPQKACHSDEHSEEESDVCLGKKQLPCTFSLAPLAANGSE
jgi:hypothetical protein